MTSRSIALLTVGLLGAFLSPAYADIRPLPLEPGALEMGHSIELPDLSAVQESNDTIHIAQLSDGGQSFTWSAGKVDGSITLEGSTPNPAIKSFLTVRAGTGADDQMQVAKGAPDDFVDNSLAGLTALNALEEGRVAFTGSKWTLGGYAVDQETLESVLLTLENTVDIADWVTFVEVAVPSAPAAEVAEAEPAMESATEPELESAPSDMVQTFLNWSVSRDADGAISFDGLVPADALQRFLRVRAGEGLTDNTEVGGTPPPQFIDNALAAVEAVKALESGRAAYTGSKWTLGGFAESREAIDAILEQLAASIDVSEWVIFLEISPTTTGESAGEETAMVEPEFRFNAQKADGGPVVFGGNVPSTAFANYAAVITGGAPDQSVANLTVNSTGPDGFITDATAALRALNTLESGQLSLEGGQWSLTGEALSDADAASVSAAITGLPDGDQWVLDLAVMPVFQLCASGVAEFSDTHTILFAPASSNLTAESAVALADLATDLQKCPAADLYVEGHTDADGPEDSNMALSVSRSEAVIAELIALGLDDRRLYAIGYGETLPVATNDTVAGKAQNRRIVFELKR